MFDEIISYVTSEEFIPMITDWGMKLVFALVIFIVGRMIAKLITKAFRK